MSTATATHPAAVLARRASHVLPTHPAFASLRQRLLDAVDQPSPGELRQLVRDLRRHRFDAAADDAGHALLVLAVFPAAA